MSRRSKLPIFISENYIFVAMLNDQKEILNIMFTSIDHQVAYFKPEVNISVLSQVDCYFLSFLTKTLDDRHNL